MKDGQKYKKKNHLGFGQLRSIFQDAPIACNFLLHFFLNLNLNFTILSILLQISQKGMTLLKEQPLVA